uniref:hypothetical protein n=1 Tax=Variovorax sp. BK018 TaxID=3450241 RepID=UPI00403A6CC0
MAELTFQQQAVIWGQAYEVLVKRGVLACLVEEGVVPTKWPSLQAWREVKLLEVSRSVTHELGLLDERERDMVKAGVQHMALTAFGIGYTATREYIKSVRGKTPKAPDNWKVRALWCPLTLPGQPTASEEARSANVAAFYKEFGLTGIVDPNWARKGQPANADFLLWLTYDGKDDALLVQEYSYDMAASVGDFREQGAHLDELMRHRRIVDSRSVFARVAAEVTGESFDLSEDIKTYLTALTSDNKPFYKLCQASSYAETAASLLQGLGLMRDAQVRALAITPNGLESLSARYAPSEAPDARRKLMGELGAAYRNAKKVADGDESALDAQVQQVFKGLLAKLPAELRKGMRKLGERLPEPGEDYVFEFEEELREFANPMQRFSLTDAIALVDDNEELRQFFGRPAKEAVGAVMRDIARGAPDLTLRDMHAGAVVAGLQCSKSGKLNVIALEGNPGIGKTTAIRRHLGGKKDSGFLFLYVSPRVVINRDVTESLARQPGTREQTGILTVTTNATLIAAAERWHKKQVELGLEEPRLVQGAVVADGVENLKKPTGPMLVLTPEQEEQVDAEFAATRMKKDTLSEHEDRVRERQLSGVLAGMAGTAKELLQLNPEVNRCVLTAALQGFRERENLKTTIDALSKLFATKPSTKAGIEERRAFAKRMPTIVVMVDELAGDGAGARFLHTIAKWLSDEFILCFEDEPSPFTVTLVASDASLGNDVVLDRYLNAGNRTPDKVLVSASPGKLPFQVKATKLRVGLGAGKRDTLHVMTNSFPASQLFLRYRVQLTAVQMQESEKKPGELETPREAIRRLAAGAVLRGAEREILEALDAGAMQVIYFAQDKAFLRELKSSLATGGELTEDTVQVLDSSVPGWLRKKLVEPERRDKVKVFLMTSSGARGVSFPLTDWIIASVPRFNIESALMEIAQLVYRGRGNYRDASGKECSGDGVPRHLVMLVDDYVVSEDGMDKRQWLRQSIDLMTLLVMLRATIFTRITGAAGLKQSLALVPVGGVGADEMVSLMSQFVSQFVKEAEVFRGTCKDKELLATVLRAQENVREIFSKTRLKGVAKPGEDGRSYAKDDYVKQLADVAATFMSPLLNFSAPARSLPEYAYFAGPVVVEAWHGFDKQEVFAFEGHETQVAEASRKLIGQLYAIDETKHCPAVLRNPAQSLLRLLQRDKHEAANEFRTLKELKSPNTWVAIPAGRLQFVYEEQEREGRPFTLVDEPLWQEALGRTLVATSAIIPPLPRYEAFPWAAAVGELSPLKLDLAFDDRYFMASNELNLLNTLLLSATSGDSRAD